jgi:S-adenosylmethionine hydrolase
MSDPIISILTDFGMDDPYVGVMKGVIARINPGARTIDLSHLIPPGDILRAGIQLWQAAPYFPAGTTFLAVVDPGVGTQRRGMIAQSRENFFIGPDNGIFSFILDESATAWELTETRFWLPDASVTFHGRDIFAPVAAYSTLGHLPAEFGPQISQPVQLPNPKLQVNPPASIAGEVLYPDRFGNLITSLGIFTRRGDGTRTVNFSPWLPGTDHLVREIDLAGAKLSLPTGKKLGIAATFSNIQAGECAGILGSSGLIEITANHRSAAELLKVARGTPVTLTWPSIEV